MALWQHSLRYAAQHCTGQRQSKCESGSSDRTHATSLTTTTALVSSLRVGAGAHNLISRINLPAQPTNAAEYQQKDDDDEFGRAFSHDELHQPSFQRWKASWQHLTDLWI